MRDVAHMRKASGINKLYSVLQNHILNLTKSNSIILMILIILR